MYSLHVPGKVLFFESLLKAMQACFVLECLNSRIAYRGIGIERRYHNVHVEEQAFDLAATLLSQNGPEVVATRQVCMKKCIKRFGGCRC